MAVVTLQVSGITSDEIADGAAKVQMTLAEREKLANVPTEGVQGPAGAKGDKGDTGAAGAQGPAGPAGPSGAAVVTRATQTASGQAPDVDVVIVKNTSAITVNPNTNLDRKAQTFRLTGTGDVTISGVMSQTIAGAAFTVTPGSDTAPVCVTLVRNPDLETQWLRVNR